MSIKCEKCKKELVFATVGPDRSVSDSMTRRTILSTRIGGEVVGYATSKESASGIDSVEILCVACNAPNFVESARGAGLFGRHLQALDANAQRHGGTAAICRAIADVLHDARPLGSDRSDEAWKRMSSAHATARRLAEILAAPL